MNASMICKILREKITIYRDGCFDTVMLIGKEQKVKGRAITYLGNPKYIEGFLKAKTSCVICTKEIAELIYEKYDGGIICSLDPKTSFFEIHNYLAEKNEVLKESKIDESVIIHPTAIIENNNVVIGENTVIGANVIIKAGTKIGRDCVLREGVIVGTPGFYYYGEKDKKKLVRSTGGVQIGNNVELHPNTVIEKGVLYGDTIIGDNTKIDNLTLIGHDSNVGDDCIIAAGTTFAGGVEFGQGAFAGVGVSIAPNVKVGTNAKISAGAVVTKNVDENTHVSGNFAIPHDEFIRRLKRGGIDER